METIKRTKIVDVLKSEAFGTTVNVKGWVRTRRGSKQVNFIALNDGSTINNVQIVVDVDKLGDEFLKPITTGASISVNGILTQSQGKGQSVEIQATEIEIFGTADPATYPLQKKGHSMEFCVRSLICVLVRIHLERYSVFVTIWLTLSISFSMIEAFSISIRRSSRLPTVRVPDRCSKLLPRICTT